MKVTVCELNDDLRDLECDWSALAAHVRAEGSRLVLLPEMPFFTWFPRAREFDHRVWRSAVSFHDLWLARLPELSPAVVLGSRPVERDGRRLNEGFIWDEALGIRAAHAKHYLPDEEGFWEASWYARGPADFTPCEWGAETGRERELARVGQNAQSPGQSQAVGQSSRPVFRAGFAICTELWFFERARAYGRQGVNLLVNPRGTLQSTVEKWLVGGRAAAIVSGAFCLSSNRVSREGSEPVFGGQGWITAPDGDVLGVTSRQQPFLTLDLDLRAADAAKTTYPRYVAE